MLTYDDAVKIVKAKAQHYTNLFELYGQAGNEDAQDTVGAVLCVLTDLEIELHDAREAKS